MIYMGDYFKVKVREKDITIITEDDGIWNEKITFSRDKLDDLLYQLINVKNQVIGEKK